MKNFIAIIVGIAVLSLLGWLRLQVKPKPFKPYPEQAPSLDPIPLPDSLPAPVERIYKTVYMEAMRYRDAGSPLKKVLWITKTLPGEYIEGTQISTVGSATWFDQGNPWAVFTLEEVKYNVNVSAYIRQRDP
jgi:hypothetical protein